MQLNQVQTSNLYFLKIRLNVILPSKIKGEIEVTRRRGRRRKKLLDDLKDRRGYSHLKEKALDLCGGTVLEEALDLSSDRILNDLHLGLPSCLFP
jgi:hypothetical protein